MLQRNLKSDFDQPSITWQDLTRGVPTIVGFAKLCSQVIAVSGSKTTPLVQLFCQSSSGGESQIAGPAAESPLDGERPVEVIPDEAGAIVLAALETGAISIRGDNNAFEPGQRFLAVCVELSEGRRLEFRCLDSPEQTVRFVEGFRQLCIHGLVMHQLMNEFSLTATGFEWGRTLDPAHLAPLLALGSEAT